MKESQDWTYIEDGNDLRELGVYDQLDMEYGKRIANMFLDWVESPEYKQTDYRIWVAVDETESATISKDIDGIDPEATLLLNRIQM